MNWQVNIYIYNSIKALRGGKGIIGYILETTKNGEIRTVQQFYKIAAKPHEAVLIAVTEALERIVLECEISIYVPDPFIAQSVENGSLAKWREGGWLTSKGEPVKYAELWQKMAYFPNATSISVLYTDTHPYKNWMANYISNHNKEIKEYVKISDTEADE